MAGAGFIFDLAKVGYGLYQGVEADKAYSNLPDRKKYKDAESILTEAKSGAQGLTPAEKLSYFQSQARQNAAQYQKALAYRPDMAGTVQSAINYGNINANNNLAVTDAQLKRQDEKYRAGLIERNDIRSVSDFNENLRQKEIAYGQAGQAAAQNVFGGAAGAAGEIDNAAYEKKLENLYSRQAGVSYTGAPTTQYGQTYSQPTDYTQSFAPPQQSPKNPYAYPQTNTPYAQPNPYTPYAQQAPLTPQNEYYKTLTNYNNLYR